MSLVLSKVISFAVAAAFLPAGNRTRQASGTARWPDGAGYFERLRFRVGRMGFGGRAEPCASLRNFNGVMLSLFLKWKAM